MIRITDKSALRSILNEAGRQADFYQRRGDGDLVEVWSAIEALAFAAGRTGGTLLITTEGNTVNPTPIK